MKMGTDLRLFGRSRGFAGLRVLNEMIREKRTSSSSNMTAAIQRCTASALYIYADNVEMQIWPVVQLVDRAIGRCQP